MGSVVFCLSCRKRASVVKSFEAYRSTHHVLDVDAYTDAQSLLWTSTASDQRFSITKQAQPVDALTDGSVDNSI